MCLYESQTISNQTNKRNSKQLIFILGGATVGRNDEGELYGGILNYMIVGIRKNIPFVVRSVPEVTVTGGLVKKHIEEVLTDLHNTGFNVRTVISDNHATNVSAYDSLMRDYGVDKATKAIIHPSSKKKIYLMFDSVHLIKNIRNNLLNNKRFIFPAFNFGKFEDEITVKAGEIRWKNLLDVYARSRPIPRCKIEACSETFFPRPSPKR